MLCLFIFFFFFLLLPENRFYHFMQTVIKGNSLHEISNPVLMANKKNIINLSSAELAWRVVKVKILICNIDL